LWCRLIQSPPVIERTVLLESSFSRFYNDVDSTLLREDSTVQKRYFFFFFFNQILFIIFRKRKSNTIAIIETYDYNV